MDAEKGKPSTGIIVYSALLWLYDLVVMLRAIGAELDWAGLVHLAQRQRLATTLYYCLSWCRDLFGVTIPGEVFVQLRPPLACRLVVERLTMPDPARALVTADLQPRRIIAHRAMVDSNLELLKVGVRAFFPTRIILIRRYMNDTRLPLQFYFLFYFVHPWITMIKGFRYLFRQREGSNDPGHPG